MNLPPPAASRCTVVSYSPSPDGQPANPHAGRVEDHDCSSGEIGLDDGEVGEQKAAQARGTPIEHVTKENDRRLCCLSQREKRTEVRVFRDQRPTLPCRQVEERRIAGRLKPEIPHVQRVVTGRQEFPGEPRG